jgi:hypothetical protein
MDERISQLEDAVKRLEERNRRVEGDKAWEVSLTRKLSVALLTYVVAVPVLLSIGSSKPFLDGLIPVIGYLLSTLSLPAIRRMCLSRRNH